MLNKIKKVIDTYKTDGPIELGKKIKDHFFTPRVSNYKKLQYLFKDKTGIEIGGPSHVFSAQGIFPIYPLVKQLDGCNFKEETIWEGKIRQGPNNYRYGNRRGYQYICEATDLKDIPSARYDFVISSHCLEHIANPLKAIEEWLRVLKNKGVILIIVPDKRFTFDHRRPITTFEHLLSDYENNVQEDDLTHLEEILELHDLSMDPPAGDFESFKKRSLNNFENRTLHHHVFDTPLLIQIFDFFNIKIITTDSVKPYHLVIIGIKQ